MILEITDNVLAGINNAYELWFFFHLSDCDGLTLTSFCSVDLATFLEALV